MTGGDRLAGHRDEQQRVREYLQQVIEAFKERGCDAGTDRDHNWIRVSQPSGLDALLKLYPDPSKYGLRRGRISKLEIRSSDDEPLYRYERGLDLDRLHQHAEARAFLELILAVAN